MAYLVMILIGMLIGAVLFYFILMERGQKIMIWEGRSRFGMAETEEKLMKALEDKGWKVPGIHDLQMTMKNNGFEVLPVKVYEVCRPVYANEILKRDGEKVVSSLMPCRIAIYERSNGQVFISRMNSGLMAKPMEGVIPAIMKKAGAEVEEILEGILK